MRRTKGFVFATLVVMLLASPLLVSCGKPKQATTTAPPEKTVVKEVTVTPTKSLPSVMSITSTYGGNVGEQAVAMADQLQKNLGVKFTLQQTGTTTNSIVLLKSRQVDLWMTGTSSLLDPYNGVGDYAKLEMGPQPLRMLFEGDATPIGVWTSEKTGIKTMEDIKGKRVAYFPGSITRNNTIEAFFKAHGFTYNDVKKVNFDSGDESYDAVKNGVIDVTLGGFKSAKLLEIDATVGLWIIPFSRSPEAAAKWKELMPQPLLELKKNEFTGVKVDMVQPGSVQMLAAYNHLDEEVAYRVTKSIWESMDQIQKIPITNGWTREWAIRLPLYAPFHPGSVRFFKEVGVWTPEHEKAQQEQLQGETKRIDAWKEKLKAAK